MANYKDSPSTRGRPANTIKTKTKPGPRNEISRKYTTINFYKISKLKRKKEYYT
jgi:hypothetical protein